jgi:hypothetical protein
MQEKQGYLEVLVALFRTLNTGPFSSAFLPKL